MRQITKDVNLLKENDIISILLFGLYKLSEDPDYSAIADLAYVLDKDSLFKLCSVYGGITIKIPTTEELNNLSKVLLIIDLMYHGFSFEESLKEAKIADKDMEKIVKEYGVLSHIIEEFKNDD